MFTLHFTKVPASTIAALPDALHRFAGLAPIQPRRWASLGHRGPDASRRRELRRGRNPVVASVADVVSVQLVGGPLGNHLALPACIGNGPPVRRRGVAFAGLFLSPDGPADLLGGLDGCLAGLRLRFAPFGSASPGWNRASVGSVRSQRARIACASGTEVDFSELTVMLRLVRGRDVGPHRPRPVDVSAPHHAHFARSRAGQGGNSIIAQTCRLT